MAAITRWCQYAVSAAGVISEGGATISGVGTRGWVKANSSVGDSFSLGSSNNKLTLAFDGASQTYVTLVSGTNLDPRLVAKDITEKIHATGYTGGYENAQCVWENNKLKIYSGTLGSSSIATVASGANTAHLELGFGDKTETGGAASTNTYVGGLTTSGTYNGFFDEIYHIIANKATQIGNPAKQGGNSYLGTITAGGVFQHTEDLTYTITIDVTGGTTMGGGFTFVPTMEWTTDGVSTDDSSAPVELLYADYWYKLGTKGVMVKFSEGVFNTCTAWTIACTYPAEVVVGNGQAAAGTAKYIWSSSRGDDATAAVTTSDAAFTLLGSRGVYIKFNGSGNFLAGDEFFVICKAPQPTSYGISTLNYGNVTVSTNSAVKSVMFEIMSGGVEMSTVKFGLQSHGTFSHHDAENADTEFHFGTIGPGNNAGTGSIDGKEWRADVSATDISADIPPSYLYATKQDLAVVADADNSETIGASHYMGMVADPIFLSIKLGSSEVGANASINMRCYFDYS